MSFANFCRLNVVFCTLVTGYSASADDDNRFNVRPSRHVSEHQQVWTLKPDLSLITDQQRTVLIAQIKSSDSSATDIRIMSFAQPNDPKTLAAIGICTNSSKLSSVLMQRGVIRTNEFQFAERTDCEKIVAAKEQVNLLTEEGQQGAIIRQVISSEMGERILNILFIQSIQKAFRKHAPMNEYQRGYLVQSIFLPELAKVLGKDAQKVEVLQWVITHMTKADPFSAMRFKDSTAAYFDSLIAADFAKYEQ